MNQTILSGFKLLSNELKLKSDQLQQIRLHCYITANFIKLSRTKATQLKYVWGNEINR